jgi:hypothetical protein
MGFERANPVVIPEHLQLLMRLESIFMPYATQQRRTLYPNDASHTRFVHYTSAEAALNIIKSKRIWMRNTTCMSDYREVQHGFEILNRFFSDESKRNVFVMALDACVPGAAHDAITLFDQWWKDIRFNTYLASISEHDPKEDVHGRLSMWRAFGGNIARVALVFNVPWYTAGSLALNLIFSPVAYLTEAEAHAEVSAVVENIRNNRDFLRSTDRSIVVGTVFAMLMAGAVCLKHEGFHEEREWRVIYAPKRLASSLMESSTEIFGGVPQIVYKVPLDETVSDSLRDLDMYRMFDRVIIGPSAYPWAMYEAFTAALARAGIQDAEKRVFTSGIPIRI